MAKIYCFTIARDIEGRERTHHVHLQLALADSADEAYKLIKADFEMTYPYVTTAKIAFRNSFDARSFNWGFQSWTKDDFKASTPWVPGSPDPIEED
jgi:hypothetical protein